MSTENEHLTDPEFQPLIRKYIHYVGEMLAEAKALLDKGSFDKVAKIGHNLKGTGSSYGFDEITELGNQLNTAAKSADKDGVLDNIVKLRKITNAASKSL